MFDDLIMMGAGIVLLTLTSFVFWVALPKADGPPHRSVGSAWEVMLAVGLTAGLVFGVGLVIAGILPLLGVVAR
jgi:hypothetical protein